MTDVERRRTPRPRLGGYDREGYYRVSDYELATGWVGGSAAVTVPDGDSAREPRAAFEAALLPALRRQPCVVAFSGGRDSSAVLAVATHLARRTGLPDPLPVTQVFGAGDPKTPTTDPADERSFQRLLVDHLDLADWHRLTDVADCDILGSRAREGMRRHGLLWPAMIHNIRPMVELASNGGSLILGEGGDELLGRQRMNEIRSALRARRIPPGRRIRQLLGTASPRPVRRRRLREHLRSRGMIPPYLRTDVAADFIANAARELADTPLRWDRAVTHRTASRASRAAETNFRKVCAVADAELHLPFLDPGFVGSLAAAGGWRGWPDRTAMMRHLFADVVPDEICARTGKAEFGAVAIGEPARRFLRDWDGTGLDPDVIDTAALRAVAEERRPPFGAQLLIQAAWLATEQR